MASTLEAVRLSAGLPERISNRIQLLVAAAANPDKAIRFLNRLRQESPSAFDRIASSTAALRSAVMLFSYSTFLSEAVLQNPERILQVASSGSLYRVLMAEEYAKRLTDFLPNDGTPEAIDLARFRRGQLLRIMLRDVLGIATLSDITLEL